MRLRGMSQVAWAGTAMAGLATAGIGTPGLTLTPSSQATASFTAPSAGDSIRRCWFTTHRFILAEATITTSDATSAPGARGRTTILAWLAADSITASVLVMAAATMVASTADSAEEQLADSTVVGSVAAVSMEEVVFTAEVASMAAVDIANKSRVAGEKRNLAGWHRHRSMPKRDRKQGAAGCGSASRFFLPGDVGRLPSS